MMAIERVLKNVINKEHEEKKERKKQRRNNLDFVAKIVLFDA